MFSAKRSVDIYTKLNPGLPHPQQAMMQSHAITAYLTYIIGLLNREAIEPQGGSLDLAITYLSTNIFTIQKYIKRTTWNNYCNTYIEKYYFRNMKKVDIQKLAEFIIAYCNVHGFIITPMKLQKILYYVQAWYLVRYDKEMLFDELPQAWVNGPVYRSVYNTYKNEFYRSTPLFIIEITEGAETIIEKFKNRLEIESKQVDTISVILKHYAALDESKLVLMTHSDSPWNIAREGYGDFERCEKLISAESMYEEYRPKSK